MLFVFPRCPVDHANFESNELVRNVLLDTHGSVWNRNEKRKKKIKRKIKETYRRQNALTMTKPEAKKEKKNKLKSN